MNKRFKIENPLSVVMTSVRYILVCLVIVMFFYLGFISHSRPRFINIKPSIPLPKNITIVPPGDDVEPMLAAYSGVWEGLMDDIVPYKLAVQEITDTEVKLTIAWADFPEWELEKGYQEAVATVGTGEYGPTLFFKDKLEQELTFIMGFDKKTMEVRAYYNVDDEIYYDAIFFYKSGTKESGDIQMADVGEYDLIEPVINHTPMPPDIKIIPPAAGLPPEITAFSGRWEGLDHGILEAVLIVKSIDMEVADIVISWGAMEMWEIEPQYYEAQAKVVHKKGEMPRIVYEKNVGDTFVFTMCSSGVVVEASGISDTYPWGGYYRKTKNIAAGQ